MNVTDLWLPIVLSGLATHIYSMLAWMLLPHHKPEWKRLPVEEEFIDFLSSRNVPADQYVFPMTRDPAEMKSEAFQKLQARGTGMLVIWQKPSNIGVNVALTLAFFFLAAFSIGYLATLGVPRATPFFDVFRFVATAGVLTYCFGQFPGVFWFRKRVAMEVLDGVVFALLTGLIFAALWPGN